MEKKKWNNSKNKVIKNVDLWMRIDKVLHKHSITWLWIRGHTGHIENQKCDQIARTSAYNPRFKDIYYEYYK